MDFLFSKAWYAIVFIGIGVEYLVLSRFLTKRGYSGFKHALAAFLGSGACLMLAAYALQRGDMIGIAALAMLGGFAAHGACLWLIWRELNRPH